MVDDVVIFLGLEHAPVKSDVVIILVVFSALEMVHQSQFGWVILKQDLDWD